MLKTPKKAAILSTYPQIYPHFIGYAYGNVEFLVFFVDIHKIFARTKKYDKRALGNVTKKIAKITLVLSETDKNIRL